MSDPVQPGQIGDRVRTWRAGEGGLAWNAANLAGPQTLELGSPDFAHEATMPKVHVGKWYGGEDLSPALAWGGVPAGTAQYLLMVEDPDVPMSKPAVHCAALLDAGLTGLRQGALDATAPAEGVQLLRSTIGRGYRGPGPIKGHGPHRYVFELFALATPMSGSDLASAKPRAVAAAAGPVLARARLDGFYERR